MRLFNRIFGVKPGRDAPKLERLLWFRGYYLRNLPLMVLVLGVLALSLGSSQWWIAVVLALTWIAGFARLNVEIRSEKRRS
jgi:ABC-type dipeptide/oligopeptide/nickel transport system permease subunit